MNMLIKKIALLSLTVVALLNIAACTPVPLGTIDVSLPPYEIPYMTPLGDHPDISGLRIDGNTDDTAWDGVEWQAHTITTSAGEINCFIKGIISEKGIAVAFKTDDANVFWYHKSDWGNNTYLDIKHQGKNMGAKNRTVSVDPAGAYSSANLTNARTSYRGDLSSGKISGFEAESFLAWESIEVDCPPEEFTITLTYYYKTKKLVSRSSETWDVVIVK